MRTLDPSTVDLARLAKQPALHPQPALYVVATPLGNLQDITFRGLAVLHTVDVIAAEDTRHSQRLLDHYGIRCRMLALHQHNERHAAEQLLHSLAAGQHIALITDAGTPGVSDPGAKAVAAVQAAGYPVIPLPGPSAAITALSASGLSDNHFLFYGFLPTKSQARCKVLAELQPLNSALVFYEAPHRIVEMVADLAQQLEPEREIVIARELTKMFEQIVRLPLHEAPGWLASDDNHCKGEFVVLVSAPPPREGISPEAERWLMRLSAELPLKTAAKIVAEMTGVSKNLLYQHGLDRKQT